MSYLIILCVFIYIALYVMSCIYIKLFRGDCEGYKISFTALKTYFSLKIYFLKSRANFNLNMLNETVYNSEN